MCDPRYRYQPWSDERRQRASALAKRRIGALPGHSIIYGVQVPDEAADFIRKTAHEIARKQGRVVAAAWVADMDKQGWPKPPRERLWTPIEARRLRELHEAGFAAGQIAKKLGRTRNAVLGKIFRSGLSKPKPGLNYVAPPSGCVRVPADMVWEFARGHMESDGPDAEAAAFCIAPMFGEYDPVRISDYLGIPRQRSRLYARRLRENGLWGPRGLRDLDRYTREQESGFIALVLDALVCLGDARRKVVNGEELWSATREG